MNAVASKDGDVYLMGGLINGDVVRGDLWLVESGPTSMSCYPIATVSEGPGPRVGHASLLVGNAFIVFGGDTKMADADVLDDTLYLLNTSKSKRPHESSVTDLPSFATVVARFTTRTSTLGTLRTHSEHRRFKNLHFWWSGGRLLLQRPDRLRPERAAEPYQSVGIPCPRHQGPEDQYRAGTQDESYHDQSQRLLIPVRHSPTLSRRRTLTKSQ